MNNSLENTTKKQVGFRLSPITLHWLKEARFVQDRPQEEIADELLRDALRKLLNKPEGAEKNVKQLRKM